MSKYEHLLLITAYVDDEIEDQETRAFVEGLIKSDPEYRREYLVQKSTKDALSKRLGHHNTPGSLKNNILDRLRF